MINILRRRHLCDTLEPIDNNIFTITAIDDNIEIYIYYGSLVINLEYKINNGQWNEYLSGQQISLASNLSAQFRGNNSLFSTSESSYAYLNTSGLVACSGDLTSLLNMVGGDCELPSYCFYQFFYNSQIVTPPNLPSTTLGEACYMNLFRNCYYLIDAPLLPATTLTSSCYRGMFWNCTSLTYAPELQAMSVPYDGYRGMFYGCTALEGAPDLPADTIGYQCYYNMFKNCSRLSTAPSILPATELAYSCYESMFYGCSLLIESPILPAANLETHCYNQMFGQCASLNRITALCISGYLNSSYSYNWIQGVAANGTFVKNPAATHDFGANAIPSNWTITDYNE